MSEVYSPKTPIDRQAWIDVASERAGIMEHDGGLSEPLAKAKAKQDTISRFGHCPKVAA